MTMNEDVCGSPAPTLSNAPSYGRGEGAKITSDGRVHEPIERLFDKLIPLNIEPKVNKDGKLPQKRGPKPDSKPAISAQREANRHAQRQFRQRKDEAMKKLEAGIMLLKQDVINLGVERTELIRENQRLCSILNAHGIHYGPASPGAGFGNSPLSQSSPKSGMSTGGSGQPSSAATTSPSLNNGSKSPQPWHVGTSPQGVDLRQASINFILKLEKPCKDHSLYLNLRAHNPDGQPHHHPAERPDDMQYEHMCGHTLMMTSPPYDHVMEKPGVPYPHQMPQGAPDETLMRLIELSAHLPVTNGELAPVQVWMFLIEQQIVQNLNQIEIGMLEEDLGGRVRCYGFGAVVEQFEVWQAVQKVIATRPMLSEMQMEPLMSPQVQYQTVTA